MNKTQVSAIIASNPYAATKAVVLLFGLQTHTERGSARTVESNGVGFRANHADFGTYCARWVLGIHKTTPPHIVAERLAHYLQGDNYKRYRCLSGMFLARAQEVTPMYWRQLAHAAKVKAAVVPY
jgi:hypothetical protein